MLNQLTFKTIGVRLKNMKASDLSPNPKNPRKISKEQLLRLEKSLGELGDLGCIVFNRRTKRLCSGHQRFKIIPKESDIVIEEEFEEPSSVGTVALGYILYRGEKFKYREVDWDETTEMVANLAANKHGGEFDFSILPDVLLELDAANVNWDLTGFELDEIEDILAPHKINEGLTDEDEVPEVKESCVRRGDIYQLGEHRLMCGDSTSITDIEKLMNGEKADMVFTDPPYGMNLNVNYDEMFGAENSSHKNTGKRFKAVKGDDVEYDPNPIFAIPAKEYYIWGADYFYDKLPRGGSWIAWDKRDESLDRVPGNTTEFLWSKNPHRRVSLRVKWSGHHGMQSEDTRSRIHPTQKPVKLIEKFFEDFGSKHISIMDAFKRQRDLELENE